MKVGILVDATCDIPTSILDRHQVTILPTQINFDADIFPDNREVNDTLTFYNTQENTEFENAFYQPAKADDFQKLLESELLYKYDQLIFIAPHIKFSSTLQNIREALFDLQPTFQKLRAEARITTPFKVRIIESQQAYSGYGLVLYEALRLLNEKARSADQIKAPLNEFRLTVETFILPGNLNGSHEHLSNPPFNLNWLNRKKHQVTGSPVIFKIDSEGFRHQGHIRGSNIENSFLENVYDHLTRTNLNNHLVNISYAGKLAQLRVTPAFKALHDHVKSKRGKLVYSNMSPSSATQLGLGAMTVSFAGEQL